MCSFVAFPEDEEEADEKPKSRRSPEKKQSKIKKYSPFVEEESQAKEKDIPKDSLNIELVNVARNPDQAGQIKVYLLAFLLILFA